MSEYKSVARHYGHYVSRSCSSTFFFLRYYLRARSYGDTFLNMGEAIGYG